MTTHYGRFGSDGDWSNANNWSQTRYGATGGGSTPASNDEVYFLDPIKFAVTSGLSQGAVDLNSMTVGPDFNGNIGAAGTPLTIAVSGTSGATLRYAGQGAMYITAGTNGIDRAIINPRGQGRCVLTGGTTAIVENVTGDNEVASGATATTIYNFARLNLASGATVTTVNNEAGGTCGCEVNTTTINNDAGATITVKRTATITTLNNRGTHVQASNGTITTANCFAGSRATATAPFTVTTLNKHVGSYAWEAEPVVVTKTTTNTIGY